MFRDDFHAGLQQWVVEAEPGGRVEAADGRLVIDVPGGCTVWFAPELAAPVEITYEVTLIAAGGPNDRVSDMNCFWMAQDARSPADFFATPRSGRFPDYNQLHCYYVGHGGWDNTRTRFRRYIGRQHDRPLLPEHDLRDAAVLLVPNQSYRIRLVTDGGRVEYHANGRRLFAVDDPQPYARGRFGFRTVRNHMEVRAFTVRRPAKDVAQTASSSSRQES